MISKNLSDAAILRELGARLTAARVSARLTQAMLADAAGVSKRTVERLESGTNGAQLASLIRVCRVLDLMAGFEALVPPATPSPMDLLKLAGRTRKRVRVVASTAAQQPHATYTADTPGTPGTKTQPASTWTWGEPERSAPSPSVTRPKKARGRV